LDWPNTLCANDGLITLAASFAKKYGFYRSVQVMVLPNVRFFESNLSSAVDGCG